MRYNTHLGGILLSRHCKHWIKSYIEYTRASESPTAFHFWTGVGTIASALRRRTIVDELSYQIIPNFYIILVGPAGVVKKSTTINLGVSLLEEVEDIYFGPNSGSWQGVGDAMSDSRIFFKYNPDDEDEKPRPMSALTIAASELGTFLRPDDTAAVSFLTDMWDGKLHTFRHKTKHSGNIEIENPCINILGATTPSWIRSNIPESMIGDGLMSRVLFVYSEQIRQPVARPSKVIQGREFYLLRSQLIEDLNHISKLAGEFQYSPAADEWMDKWYNNLMCGERPPHMASDRFGGYLSRKQAHLIKLAMVLSVARGDNLVFQVQDFEEANALLETTEQSMLKVFESIGVVDEVRHIAEMVQFIRAYKWLTIDELYYRHCFNIMSKQDFAAALRTAIDGQLIMIVQKDGKRGLAPAARTLN